MRSILALHRTTYIEIARHPAFYVLTLFAALAIWISQYFILFGFHSNLNAMREVGHATLAIWAVLSCVLLSHQSIFVEIENRSALTVLTKPLHRHHYVFGKYLGLARALCLGLLFLLLVFILTLWSYEGLPKLTVLESRASLHPYPFATNTPVFDSIEVPMSSLGSLASGCALSASVTSPEGITLNFLFDTFASRNIWPILVGGFLIYIQSLIISGFSVALATFFPPVVVATGTISVYLIGHLTDLLSSALSQSGPLLNIVGQFCRWVLPNLELFNPADHLSRGQAVSAIYVALSAGYGILYVSIVLVTTAFAFSRRELP
jgi:hypothetical protein